MTYYAEIKHIAPNYIVTVERDDDPQSPADWDNFGTLVHCHSRYTFGDECVPQDYIRDICEDEDNIWLPVYLYSHSGVTIKTSPFSCSWDSGQVGVIYIPKHEARQQKYDPDTEEGIAKIKEYLNGTVETWDQYMTGSVYGYRVWKIEVPEGLRLEDIKKNFEDYGDDVDSCWGFYGESEYCLSEGVSLANWHVKNDAEQVELEKLRAEKEAAEQKFWAERDVVTQGV